LSYLEISKPNLRNNLKQLFAMKNLILILALALSGVSIAQNDTIQYCIEVTHFDYRNYTFADIFFIDKEGNVDQRHNKTKILPNGSFSGMNSTALAEGSSVIVDLYNRDGSFDHSFSAYIVRDKSDSLAVKVVESSPIISMKVGEHKSYVDFVIDRY